MTKPTQEPKKLTVEIDNVNIEGTQVEAPDLAAVMGIGAARIIREGAIAMPQIEKMLDEYVASIPDRTPASKIEVLKKVMVVKGAVESLYIRLQQIY